MMSAAKPIVIAVIVLLEATLITSGSATTHVFAATQPTTSIPSCTDPTGQNLPCMMVISTLPPPPNAIQCQETSGQILPCSYVTQNLSNGEQIVAITVYVPTNYLFTGYGPWTAVKQVVHETTTKTRIVHEQCPKGQTLDHKTHKCVDISPTKPCFPGQHPTLVHGVVKCLPPCERPDSGAKTDPDKNLKTADCDINDANEHRTTPIPSPICSSSSENVTCPPKSSGGPGAGTTCVGNCTTRTPPPVDCTKDATDPSCTQALIPATTSPSTKTCPDGSVIDASATCPTQPTSPNPGNPNTQTSPPSDNSPPPGTGDNGNNNPNNDGSNNDNNNNNNNPSSNGGSGNENQGNNDNNAGGGQ